MEIKENKMNQNLENLCSQIYKRQENLILEIKGEDYKIPPIYETILFLKGYHYMDTLHGKGFYHIHYKKFRKKNA